MDQDINNENINEIAFYNPGDNHLGTGVASYDAINDLLSGYAPASGLTSVSNSVGTLTSLTTTAKTDLVSAINEVKSDIPNISGYATTSALGTTNTNVGTLSNLNTSTKTDLVSAINSVNTALETANGTITTNTTNIGNNTTSIGTINTNIGTLSSLNTTAKTIVPAINEVLGDLSNYATTSSLSNYATTAALGTANGNISTNTNNIGILGNLDTTAKTDLVSALNEIYTSCTTGLTNIKNALV